MARRATSRELDPARQRGLRQTHRLRRKVNRFVLDDALAQNSIGAIGVPTAASTWRRARSSWTACRCRTRRGSIATASAAQFGHRRARPVLAIAGYFAWGCFRHFGGEPEFGSEALSEGARPTRRSTQRTGAAAAALGDNAPGVPGSVRTWRSKRDPNCGAI
jgi:hypothetical protein